MGFYNLTKLNNYKIKEMQPMELVIHYYLNRGNVFHTNTKQLTLSNMYFELCGEKMKQNPTLSKKFSEAVDHLKELGYLQTINNQYVDFSKMTYTANDNYVRINLNADCLFKNKSVGMSANIRAFKTYVFMSECMIYQPTLKNITYKDVALGLGSLETISKELGMSYQTVINHVKLLEECGLLFVDRRETYYTKDGVVKRLPNIYSHPQDRETAMRYTEDRSIKGANVKLGKRTPKETKTYNHYTSILGQIKNGTHNYTYDEMVECYNYINKQNLKGLREFGIDYKGFKDIDFLLELIQQVKSV